MSSSDQQAGPRGGPMALSSLDHAVIEALCQSAEGPVAEPARLFGLTAADSRAVSSEVTDADELVLLEQEPLPDRPLDDILARVAWPPAIAGCVLVMSNVTVPDLVEKTGTASSGSPCQLTGQLAVGVLRTGGPTVAFQPDGREEVLILPPELSPSEALIDPLFLSFFPPAPDERAFGRG